MSRRVLLLLLGSLLGLLPFRTEADDLSPSVRLLTNNPTPYVGEELILTLEVRFEGRPGDRPLIRWPHLDDFVREEMPTAPPRREEGGRTLVESVRLALRPLNAGRHSLSGGGILLGGTFFPAPALPLRVQPLPVADRPADFGGAVGDVAMEIESTGTGDREVTVTLRGNAPLAAFPPPRTRLPAGARLIPLGDTLKGLPGGMRHRRFRYRYLPRPGSPKAPAFSLVVFDPAGGSYRRLGMAPENGSRWLLPVGATASLLAILLLGLRRMRRGRPRTLEACLACLLERPARGLSRRQILAGLKAAGVAERDAAELSRMWALEDRFRFAPGADHPPPENAARQRRIVARLRKAVDKKRRIS